MASYRQNRPVLFLKGLYNTLLQLVHACSIFQGTMQHPSYNQYRPVLFLKGPYNTLLQLVQACSISQRAIQHPSHNQYTPVLFHREPCNTLLTISTGLFYLIRDHEMPPLRLIQACSNLKSLYNTIIYIYLHFLILYKTNDATHKGGVIRIRIICALVRGSRVYTAPILAYEGPYNFILKIYGQQQSYC